MESDENEWVVRVRPNDSARLRLFCLPYAGGGASAFYSWIDEIPADIELCAIQLPGRENRYRESCYTDLGSLIETLMAAMRKHFDLPFALFGHSMGALIAFEIARTCGEELNVELTHLIVSGCRAPQLQKSPPIHTLPDSEFISEIRRFGGTPAEVLEDQELMQLLLPTLRADFALCENYSYFPLEPVRCPIAAFGGMQDTRTSSADLQAWREQTSSDVSLHMFPGGHFFFNTTKSEFLRILVATLMQAPLNFSSINLTQTSPPR